MIYIKGLCVSSHLFEFKRSLLLKKMFRVHQRYFYNKIIEKMEVSTKNSLIALLRKVNPEYFKDIIEGLSNIIKPEFKNELSSIERPTSNSQILFHILETETDPTNGKEYFVGKFNKDKQNESYRYISEL